jgi:glycosyltransferase involved in cell wall biosynthesis
MPGGRGLVKNNDRRIMSGSTKKKPKVSVCVVTCNHEKYIKTCLVSALAQQIDTDLEILVGNDGSADGTRDIINRIADEYPGTIQIYNHEVKLGPSENIRFLIERSTGDFIAHLDGDDYWLPGKLELQLRFLDRHQACIGVFGNAAVVDKDNVLLGIFNNRQPELQDINYLLRRGNYLNHSSILYRSHAKNDILSISGDLLDYRISCRLALRGSLGYLNSALVAYRINVDGSLISTAPDTVRSMYWQTLQEMYKTTKQSDASIDGISHFWGLVLCDSLWRWRPAYALQWLTQIRKDMTDNFWHISIFGTVMGIGYAGRYLSNKVLSLISMNPLRIIHYR